MSRITLISPLGVLLIMSGVLVPPSTLVESIRTIPPNLKDQLILGGTIFKVGLVISGLFLLVSGLLWRSQLRTDTPAPAHRGTFAVAILAIVLVTAFLMRLYNLDVGIWFDEIVTYVSYMDRSFGEILTTYDNQNNHLLYTLLARLSFLIFGESVWTLRLPAVLFGVGSIWAVYLFSCEVATWREGLLSAGFLTFSYHHVWFSQNARGYTALLFWTMLSSWFLLRALRESKIGLWLMYGLTTALGLLTHITMVFVVVGQGVVYLVSVYDSGKGNRREQWLGGFLGFAVAGLVTFQLYSLLLPQLFQWQGKGVSSWQGTIAVAPWKSPIWMLGELFNSLNVGLGSGALLLLVMFVFGAGLIDFVRKKLPVLILFIVPVLTSVAVIMGLGSTLLPRFFFFAMGFAVIILVRSLMLCGEFFSRALHLDPVKARLAGVGLCVTLIAVSAIAVPRAYLPKQDYGGALEFVENQRQPDDIILTVGLTVFPYQRYYKVDWDHVTTLEELDRARTRRKRTWLIYTMPIVLQAAYPEIMKRIQIDFDAVREFPGTLNGGNIVVAIAKS
jgi:mannosyltransferase